MKTLIEIHVLQHFAPSNLNRDDTGAPKEAFFGGTRRARISSQCLKRAVRAFFADEVQAGRLEHADLGRRTKRLRDTLLDMLAARGRNGPDVEIRVAAALSALELKLKEGAKTEYLLFLGEREINGLADVIHKHWDMLGINPETGEETKKTSKSKKQAAAKVNAEVRETLDAVLDGGKAVDVALFGRMLADMPERNQHAACQVAHAISTHAVEREFDFYTAVDDLKPEDTAGADMMGTVEFNSACFYRYAVVDWQKLVQNLQGDQGLGGKGLRAFLEGFVVAEPSGKQNSFAAHNPPHFVAITVRRDGAPRNLANAFEVAIHPDRANGLTRASADGLIGRAKTLTSAYGAAGANFVLDLTGAELSGFGERVGSLTELLDRTMDELGAA